MDSNTRYAAVNTKIAAQWGKLLKDEDYKKMILLKSPSEIAVYLKENTSYREFFLDYEAPELHRDAIERLLKTGMIKYMDKLIHYFNGEYRNFIKFFYLKYEIYDLKRAARIVHIEKDYENLKDNLVFAGKYRYIDMDKIVKAKSIPEIIEALNGTVYEPFLRNLVDGNRDENLYRFEMSLDRAYFVILEDSVKKLLKEDQRVFYEIIGSYIDMLNLQWVYRGKKYYNLSPEELFNYTLNRGYKFNYRRVKEFCYCNDINEFIGKVNETPYGFMFRSGNGGDIFVEREMNKYLYIKLKHARQRFKLNISVILAYLEMIDFEIRDIISIIENVRYGMDYEEAKEYLIKVI